MPVYGGSGFRRPPWGDKWMKKAIFCDIKTRLGTPHRNARRIMQTQRLNILSRQHALAMSIR